MLFEINHMDADRLMYVNADSRSKAKYINYLDWLRADFGGGFRQYLSGLISCRRVKDGDTNG
jgi:hypothetical protein